MIGIQKQRGQYISPELEVRNRLDADVEIQMQYGEVRINMSKVKPPVIITLSRGRGENGQRKAKNPAADERVV